MSKRPTTVSSRAGCKPARPQRQRAAASSGEVAVPLTLRKVVKRVAHTPLAGGPTRSQQPQHVHALPQFPPGVAPSATMAADSAINGNMQWTNGELGALAAFGEGVTFFGYPYLAELAQRPEYRRAVETVARHMTRRWIKLKSKSEDGSKAERINCVKDELQRLNAQQMFKKSAELDGYFGRGHLFIDFGNSDDSEEMLTDVGRGRDKVSEAKVQRGSLRALRAIEPVWAYPTNYNSSNPLSPDWYRPSNWFVMGKQVHASRLLTFVGREVSDLLKPAYSFGGLPLSQMLKPYVDNWLKTRTSVSDIISAFSTFVLQTNVLDQLESVEAQANLVRRLQVFNNLRDNRGVLAVDKTDEDFKNVSAPLGTLDVLQAQSQEHMASVAGIPIVLLLGIQPTGLNASSDGEIQAFFEWIHSCQEAVLREPLERLVGFVQLNLYGNVDPDIVFDFEPLWSLDEKESAEKRKLDADTDAVYVDAGVVDRAEVRSRLAADEDSPYAGLDPHKLPEVPGELDDVGALPGEGSTPGEPDGAALVHHLRSGLAGGASADNSGLRLVEVLRQEAAR